MQHKRPGRVDAARASVWIALAALVAGLTGFTFAFLVGVAVTGGAGCDGPCSDRWDLLSYVAYAVCALVAGWIARTALGRAGRA